MATIARRLSFAGRIIDAPTPLDQRGIACRLRSPLPGPGQMEVSLDNADEKIEKNLPLGRIEHFENSILGGERFGEETRMKLFAARSEAHETRTAVLAIAPPLEQAPLFQPIHLQAGVGAIDAKPCRKITLVDVGFADIAVNG